MFPDETRAPISRGTYGRRVAAVLRSMTKQQLLRQFRRRNRDLRDTMSKAEILRHLSRLGWSRATYR